MQHRHRNLGFTLVELLVVIGIIALLISILLPALTAARDRANRVVCMSNLHQCGIMLTMYANEQKRYPTSMVESGAIAGYTVTPQEIADTRGVYGPAFDMRTLLQSYTKDWRVLYCPSNYPTVFDPNRIPIPLVNGFVFSGYQLYWGTPWTTGLKMTTPTGYWLTPDMIKHRILMSDMYYYDGSNLRINHAGGRTAPSEGALNNPPGSSGYYIQPVIIGTADLVLPKSYANYLYTDGSVQGNFRSKLSGSMMSGFLYNPTLYLLDQ